MDIKYGFIGLRKCADRKKHVYILLSIDKLGDYYAWGCCGSKVNIRPFLGHRFQYASYNNTDYRPIDKSQLCRIWPEFETELGMTMLTHCIKNAIYAE